MKQKEEDRAIYVAGARQAGEWNPGEPIFMGMVRNHPKRHDCETAVTIKRVDEQKRMYTKIPVNVYGTVWEEYEVKFI